MSHHAEESSLNKSLVIPMLSRSPHEAHRVATPLELLFDLVFVIAVAQAAVGLHHGIAENHIGVAVLSFVMIFFAIWWAWMNFSWFASAYDTDDVPYRLMVFVQMIGALILAVGVPYVFDGSNFTIVTVGYTVMRFAQITQWLRAARSDPAHRATTTRYAIGLTVVQIGWLLRLLLPAEWGLAAFIVLAIAEIVVPVWAEGPATTTWHPHHIAERYGLFTIIVLGESILSSANAIQADLEAGQFDLNLLLLVVGSLLIVFSLWWLYFDRSAHDLLTSLPVAFTWGYGHYLIFAAVAAVGAGIAVSVDQLSHHAEISSVVAGMAVAIPVVIFLLSLWVLHRIPWQPGLTEKVLAPVVAVLILLTPFVGHTILWIGLLLAALLALKLIGRQFAPSSLG